MSDKPINKMDVKQLRDEVQLLRDELAIMKRKYEDIIYNLDDENFSSRFVKEKNGIKTTVEVTAEGIKTKVSKEELTGALTKYSTKEQTEYLIKTAVASEVEGTLEGYSTIEQTSEQISTTVSKKVFYEDATIGDLYPTESNTTDEEKERLYFYTYDEKYYLWDASLGEWVVFGDGNIYSAFIQTPDGFSLKGNVSISGDLISGGGISGARFYDSSQSSYLELESASDSYADLYLRRANGTNVFTIYDGVSYVSLKSLDNEFLRYYSGAIHPRGVWDFGDSDCVVQNLYARFG